MKPALRPAFRLTRHARQRMAHRNLSPELFTSIQSHGTMVADGFVMLQNDIAGAQQSPRGTIRPVARVESRLIPRTDRQKATVRTPYAHQEIRTLQLPLEILRRTAKRHGRLAQSNSM